MVCKNALDQPQNLYGGMWGRKFYQSCSEMNALLQPLCGDGKTYQVNGRGYVVYVGNGNSWKDGINKNLWQTILPVCTGTVTPDQCIAAGMSPFGAKVPLYWGMPIVDRPLKGEVGEGGGIPQIIGHAWRRLALGSRARRLDAFLVQLHGLLDVARQHFRRWQIGHAHDAAELAHRLLIAGLLRADDQFMLPETERAMLLERRHAAQHAVVHERRHSPLQRFFHLWTGAVHDVAHVLQNRSGKFGGAGDISIDTWIAGWHGRYLAKEHAPASYARPMQGRNAERTASSLVMMF